MTFGENSRFEELARKRAFLLLILDNLKTNIRNVESDITKCYMEKSKFEESVRKRAFLILILNNLKTDVRDIKSNITQCDKEIIFLIEHKRKHEPSTVNRSILITGIAKTLSTHDLFYLIIKLRDNKKQFEKNLNILE
jgi:predicted nuclease with TOPRIM domain